MYLCTYGGIGLVDMCTKPHQMIRQCPHTLTMFCGEGEKYTHSGGVARVRKENLRSPALLSSLRAPHNLWI